MDSKPFYNISPAAKLISLIFLALCIVVAKSIYLILFMTILIIILCACSKHEVKEYVKFLKDIDLTLVIFIAFYIIILRQYNILNVVIAFYKSILISLSIKLFDYSNNFCELNEALYGTLYIFKKNNLENICYNISMSLYLIKYFIESKGYIRDIQLYNDKRILGLKYSFLPRIIYSVDELNDLKIKYKSSHYSIMSRRSNFKSKLVIFTSILFFIICIFKEVIL